MLTSCSLFEYHPYETNMDSEHTDLNSKAIERIIAETEEKDTITIIAMGDTQRFYDEVEDFVKSANQQNADFILLNGDISDFGIKDEFEWIDKMMCKLTKPYLAVIGNHDLIGNGETVYKNMYGPLNSSFILHRTKFILLNTNSREYKFNGRVPDIGWLKNELNGDTFDNAVVVSHIPPYHDDFDKNLEDDYATALSQSQKVNLSLHGHIHAFEEGYPYEDGIHYIVSTSMNNKMYLLIKITDNSSTMQQIFY
jgi:3',5'-cyclic-AMP phosphodiesterase